MRELKCEKDSGSEDSFDILFDIVICFLDKLW